MIVESILRSWAKSKEPTLQKAFIQYAFGKVPDKFETDPLENKTTLVLHFDHERGVTSEHERENGSRISGQAT